MRSDDDQPVMVEREKPAISYEPTTTVTRRQFRLLLVLTLLNTLMLGFFVCGPSVSRFGEQFLKDYHQREREKVAQKARQAAAQRFESQWQQAMNYSMPAGQVLYEEDPDRAAKLSDTGGYSTIISRIPYMPPRQWHAPVCAAPPNFGFISYAPSQAVLLVHGLKLPNGQQVLATVELLGQQEAQPDASMTSGDQRKYFVRTSRILAARIYRKGQGSPTLDQIWNESRLKIVQSDAQESRQPFARSSQSHEHESTILWNKNDSWENGRVEFQLRDIFRFFPAQVDPADSTHFTIPYELDGVGGVIDGYARSSSVDLVPRKGRIVGQREGGFLQVWNPYAEAAKSTQ